MKNTLPNPLVWIVDPHPQSAAISYSIRLLSALVGRAARIVKSADELLGIELAIHYGARRSLGESKHYAIIPDEHFWRRLESGAAIAPEGASEWRGVIFPRWAEAGVSRKLESPSSRNCPVDPVAAAFFLVSRIEELRSRDEDDHGRFPAESSWMARMGLIERPLVHEYARALLNAITGVENANHDTSPWPDGHRCALAFTHDVDRMRMHGSLWRDARSGIGGLRNRGGVRAGLRRVTSLLRTRILGKRDPFDTVDEILSGQERRGFRSTWFWIASKPSVHNADYSPTHPTARAAIKSIQERGHEIGLHGSYESGENPDLLSSEREILESVTQTQTHVTRQHYLRFRAASTWNGHTTAGLAIDSTLGFAARMGFRSGLAIPFQPWDFARQRPYDLWEVPLVMMDVTAREYMGLSQDEATARSRQILASISRIGGAAAVLWHNSSLNEIDWRGWRVVHESWLDAATENHAWCASMTDIVERWKGHLSTLEQKR